VKVKDHDLQGAKILPWMEHRGLGFDFQNMLHRLGTLDVVPRQELA
jgi:FtsZ-interacting cell division protein ZipA